MINPSMDQLRNVLNNQRNIRNMCIISSADCGKSTFISSLISSDYFISNDTSTKTLDTDLHESEQSRDAGVFCPKCISLYYSIPKEDISIDSDNHDFLINLINYPDCNNFFTDYSSAIRISDGALIIIDFFGLCMQIETRIRKALSERLKLIVLINKFDLYLFESNYDPSEEIYQSLDTIVNSLNTLISTYTNNEISLSPAQGTICFGSCLHEFCFNIPKFSTFYHLKFGVQKEKFANLLWGEYYWDFKTKKFLRHNKNSEGETLQRSFCQFILSPIIQLIRSIMNNETTKYKEMLNKIGVKLSKNEEQLKGIELVYIVLNRWLSLTKTILEMIILHLPSPKEAQRYRCDTFYTGLLDDEFATSIKNCDPNGPLMLYISKMIPTKEPNKYYSFGRIFSGTISKGQKVYIMGITKDNLYVTNIQHINLMMNNDYIEVNDCKCGNMIILEDIDQYLIRTGTITSSPYAFPFKNINLSVSPFVKIYIEPKQSSDLLKFINTLNYLSKEDDVQISKEETGEHIILSNDENKLINCIDYFDIPINYSSPNVIFNETITNASSIICMAKSSNKLNRILMKAEPLNNDLVKAIENNEISAEMHNKLRSEILINKYNWENVDARRIWSFGPNYIGPNLLVDITRSNDRLHEIKESLINAFQYVTKFGVLCNEPIRGIRFNIIETYLTGNLNTHKQDQIIPCGRRVLYASELSAEPTLTEPIYNVEIRAPPNVCNEVFEFLSNRRYKVFNRKKLLFSALYNVYLPVRNAFGFKKEIKKLTANEAEIKMHFDHWENIQGNALEDGSELNELIRSIRKKKGLKEDLPSLDEYNEKF